MQNHPFPGSGPCTGLWNGPQGRRAHLVGFGGQILKMLQFIQFLSNFSDILSKVATREAPKVVLPVNLTKTHRNVIYGQYQLGQGRPDLPQRQFFLRRDTPQWFIQHKNRCQKVSSASDYLSGPIYSHLNPKNAKTRFLGVNRQKGLKKRCTVPQTCSKNLVRYSGRSMGHYPFGIFKIRPKIRLGRRFENSKENQHEFWTRLTTV